MLLPLLIGFTTWAGFTIFENPWIEYGFIISGIVLAYYSLGKSLKEHHNHTPTRMAIVGVVILIVSRLQALHDIESVLTVFGALFLIVAHTKNIQVTYQFRSKSNTHNK